MTVQKKSPKSMKKSKSERMKARVARRRMNKNFKYYIYKILKAKSSNYGASAKSMDILNSMVLHVIDLLGNQGSNFAKSKGKRTLSHTEIAYACAIIFPKDLARRLVDKIGSTVGQKYDIAILRNKPTA